MLRESGVVDAGGHGLVLILAGVVAGLRGDGAEVPEVAHHEPPRLSRPHHEDSRYRYCTNFIVSGSGLDARDFLPRLEGLGDSVLVVGDEATLKVHVHTDDAGGGGGALRGRRGGRPTSTSPTCASRSPSATPGSRAGRTGVVAVAAGEGLERLFAELGADVVPGGETLNPSTYELLAGIHEVPAEEVLVLPSSSNVIMAAERACELSEKPARVVAGDVAAGEPAGAGRARPRGARSTRTPSGSKRRWRTSPPAASPRRPATTPRGASARATRSASPTARSSPGAAPARPWRRRSSCSPSGAEIVTVIGGDGAPIPLDEVDAHVPDGVEIEKHEGGQPSWWWLLAAQ